MFQDYHRFHVPVSGTIEKFVNIPGNLYTVRGFMQLNEARLAVCDYFFCYYKNASLCLPALLSQVNPIAVNSKYCNVFTENKRVVSIISTTEFGKVYCHNHLTFNTSHMTINRCHHITFLLVEKYGQCVSLISFHLAFGEGKGREGKGDNKLNNMIMNNFLFQVVQVCSKLSFCCDIQVVLLSYSA